MLKCPHCGKEISHTCTRCGHKWPPREAEPPKVCPKCKSPYWDRPRQKPR